MERSPYDPSSDEAIARNENRLKEELERFHSSMDLIEGYLEKMDMTFEEVLQSEDPPTEKEKKKNIRKKHARKNWLRI